MKSSDIKNLIRYALSKANEFGVVPSISKGLILDTIGFNVLWYNDHWEPFDKIVCPLSIILLIKQEPPTPQNLYDNWRIAYGRYSYNGHVVDDMLIDYRFFPETLAHNALKEILGVNDNWIYSCMDGMCAIKSTKDTDKNGYDVGGYIAKRLENKQ